MKRQRLMTLLIAAGLLLPVSPALWADRGNDREEMRGRSQMPARDEVREPRYERDRTPERQRRVEAPGRESRESRGQEPMRASRRPPEPPPPGYVLDKRYGHDRYYPPPGHPVNVLPPAHRTIVFHNERYFFFDGIWYRPRNSHFIVVRPPIGVIVPVLPSFYTVIWVGAVPYYYAAGIYYTWYPEYRAYVVSEPPPPQEVRETGIGTEQLFVYPKQGQSEEQMAKDRYECHRWGSDQTGFDPTQPGGEVAEGQYANKRADYLRAMKACLEARGYSVQ